MTTEDRADLQKQLDRVSEARSLELQEAVTLRLEQALSIEPEYSVTDANPIFRERMASTARAKPALRAVPLIALVTWFVVTLCFLVVSVPRSLR